LDLTVNAQNFRHLLFELVIALFQIVANLVWFDFLLSKNLAHRALGQFAETFVPRRRRFLTCMARQQPCRPQLVRITVILGFVACQRHQPSLGLRCNRRLLSWSWSVIESRQRAIGQHPLDTALDGLMMHANPLPHRIERGIRLVRQQYLRPLNAMRRLGSRARNSCQLLNLFVGHRQFHHLTPSCHDAAPRLINHKPGIHELIPGSMLAGFMESVV
jgi:hypothetical protein